MSAHTPGPWRVISENNSHGFRVEAEDGNICVPCYGRGPLDEANARLIAAAPELLDALKALVAETERCDRPGLYGVGSDEPVMEAARAAIAKAEGR